jgi:hypothetical protein
MTTAQAEHVRAVARSVEERINDRPDYGVLDNETVSALDIVAHALTFAKPPDALTLWRDALWRRRLSETSRAALNELLTYIVGEAARGEMRTVSDICNCLEAVVDLDVRAGRDSHPETRTHR